MTIRDANDLRQLSAKDRKKLTKAVVKGANELQREVADQYERIQKTDRPSGC